MNFFVSFSNPIKIPLLLLLLIAFAVDKYFEIIQQLREDFQIHSEILLG